MFQAFSLCGTCSESERLRIAFADCYKKDYPKAAGRLLADWDHMATIYSYPEEHWVCIWTTKVVESPLISARLRTDAAERFMKMQKCAGDDLEASPCRGKEIPPLRRTLIMPDV